MRNECVCVKYVCLYLVNVMHGYIMYICVVEKLTNQSILLVIIYFGLFVNSAVCFIVGYVFLYHHHIVLKQPVMLTKLHNSLTDIICTNDPIFLPFFLWNTHMHVQNSLRCMTLPKTVWSLSNALQFQRWWRNWCWHSRIHSLAPPPMDCMMSGYLWHSCLCLFTSPGILSQITRAPSAPIYLKHANTEA